MAPAHGGQFRSGRGLVRLTCAKPASPHRRRAFSRSGPPARHSSSQQVSSRSPFQSAPQADSTTTDRAPQSSRRGSHSPPSATPPPRNPTDHDLTFFIRMQPPGRTEGRRGASPPSPQAKSTRPWLASLRPHQPASIFLALPSPISPTGKGSGRSLGPGPDTTSEDNKQ
jgi:hypothetical protein